MNRHAPPRDGLPLRVALIGAATVLMVASLFALDSALTNRGEEPAHPPTAPMAAPGDPIAAEADVFRTRADDLAVHADVARRGVAHPRTLATFRALRAYPGAPPRIPHGLTREEFRTGSCNTCHERGGFSARFAAYVPVTPHPELTDCLQCHAGDATVVGIDFPGSDRDALCLQCHRPGASRASFVALDWRPAAWPQPRGPAPDGTPPAIPHDLQLRGNCLACHLGPGAVEEIRTTHPERANCRQCHVPAPPETGDFTRVAASPAGPRDRPRGEP